MHQQRPASEEHVVSIPEVHVGQRARNIEHAAEMDVNAAIFQQAAKYEQVVEEGRQFGDLVIWRFGDLVIW